MSYLISRRQFIVNSAVAIIGAHPLCRSLAAADRPLGSRLSGPSSCAYYSPGHSAPWSQSPAELSLFLSSEHLDYDLDGWFFFGSLIERSGRKSAFLMAVQRINETVYGIRVPFFPAAVAYNNPSLGCYLFGGCYDIDIPPLVTVTHNPWKVTVVCPSEPVSLMSMELLSGQMGQAGATYLLNAAVTDQFGERLTASVTLRDRMGVVNEGYGPSSFYPQWITPLQRFIIRSDFGGSVGSYLRQTADPMVCQGSYYYSLGLIGVEHFRIGVGSRSPFATGVRGTFWMDYVVETYNETAQSVISDASWQFLALQFPSRGEALLVNRIDTSAGRLNIARLYKENSASTLNGALTPFAQWDSDKIRIQPIPGTNWTSKESGLTYPMEYRITLGGGSKVGNGELVVRSVRHNQEIIVKNTVKYEGLMTVDGWLGRNRVHGQAWAELQPVGHL